MKIEGCIFREKQGHTGDDIEILVHLCAGHFERGSGSALRLTSTTPVAPPSAIPPAAATTATTHVYRDSVLKLREHG